MKTLITHKSKMNLVMLDTKRKVCNRLRITSEKYDLMHYELAYGWLRYNRYLPYIARVYIVSKIFHSWWNQQMAITEIEFLRCTKGSNHTVTQLRNMFFDNAITMAFEPSAELRRMIYKEGESLLNQNPELKKLKVYEDE